MSTARALMDISSEHFEKCVTEIVTHLWGTDVPDEAKDLLFQRILGLLREQNITSVTRDDVTLIIISAINRAFMNPLNYLELFITEDCNLRCDYCFIKRKTHSRMTPEVASEAIDFFVLESGNNEELSVTYFGGEPLLEFELMREITRYAENVASRNGKKISFSVTTNGTLFTEDILEFSKGRVSYLISIDGDGNTHDLHRRTVGGKGSYDMVSSKLPLVKQYQPWLGARMTVYPDTVDVLFDNVAYLFSIGFNQFIIGPSYGPKWNDKALANYEKQLDRIGVLYLGKKQNEEPFRMTFFESKSGNRFCNANIWGCRAGRNGITVSADGRLYPCSKFLGLSGLDKEYFCLGDISTGITKLDIRDQLVGMNSEHFTECIGCEAIDYCTGGCPANNHHDTGYLFKPSPFDCAIARIHKRVLQRFEKMERQAIGVENASV